MTEKAFSPAREESLRTIEQEISLLLRRVRRVIGERARQLHPDLPSSAYLVVAHVREHQPLRAASLCSVFELDKGAVSRQVHLLLDLGLIERTPDPDDGRATLIQLSAEGERRFADLVTSRRQGMQQRLSEWSDDDLARFSAELGRYNRSLSGAREAQP